MKKLILIVSMIAVPAISIASEVPFGNSVSKKILMADYKDKEYWPALYTKKNKAIEFCGGDWCQEVVLNRADSVQAAWDALFLIFYYYDANEQYTKKRSAHAKFILAGYAEECRSSNDDKKVSCVLSKLQAKHKFQYNRVQYDIGGRCTSVFSAKPPHFTGRGRCVGP